MPQNIIRAPKFKPNFYDVTAGILILAVMVMIAWGASGMHKTLAELQAVPIDLALKDLPKYALFTTLRMFAAITAAIIFSLFIATIAAKNRIAGLFIIPALDVIQAVPVLGILAFTITFFTGLFPGQELGAEIAAIFAIFTNQIYNLAMSLYQSFITEPNDLVNVSKQFHENSRQKYWHLELPFAMPGLIWNIMMSMSGGWFFIIASEALAVGETKILLPGIGSWLSLAISHKDLPAIAWAIVAMVVVIIVYDQLLFRPLVAWSNKFSMTKSGGLNNVSSWLYALFKRSNFFNYVREPLSQLRYFLLSFRINVVTIKTHTRTAGKLSTVIKLAWYALLFAILIRAVLLIYFYVMDHPAIINLANISEVLLLGLYTWLRVATMIILASIIWVPIGVLVGLRPRLAAWVQPLAQLLAAFPANILFPLAVIVILHFNLNPNIWLAPLLLLGSQWYILFNIIAGAKALPSELHKTAAIYKIRSWLWWRKIILPGIFPYYVTGAIAAVGGAWNASIVAEVVSWGDTEVKARGLGSYIAEATAAGDMNRVLLGVVMMSLFIVAINITVWQRLYFYAAQHFRFD